MVSRRCILMALTLVKSSLMLRDYTGGITGTAYCKLRCDWSEMKVYKDIDGAQKIDPDSLFTQVLHSAAGIKTSTM